MAAVRSYVEDAEIADSMQDRLEKEGWCSGAGDHISPLP